MQEDLIWLQPRGSIARQQKVNLEEGEGYASDMSEKDWDQEAEEGEEEGSQIKKKKKQMLPKKKVEAVNQKSLHPQNLTTTLSIQRVPQRKSMGCL